MGRTMMTDEQREVARVHIKADEKVYISDHPLIHNKIAILRDAGTNKKEFRELVNELAMLLTYEATRDLLVMTTEIVTGMNVKAEVQKLSGKDVVIAVILRASLGMIDGVLELLPTAAVAHIGIYRDPETKSPTRYYFKAPSDVAEREVFVIDPMLATGGSAIDAITQLKYAGCQKIHFICILAVPEGVAALREAHPDVDIYIGEMDEKLDENAYILPGLGDAGDRLYGTK